MRLDHFLVEQLPDNSRTQIQRMIKSENVTVNGRIEKSSYKLQEGDTVFTKAIEAEPELYTIMPELIPLDILFEDDDDLYCKFNITTCMAANKYV